MKKGKLPKMMLSCFVSLLKQQREKILALIEIRGKSREIEGWADLLFDIETWDLDRIQLPEPEGEIG